MQISPGIAMPMPAQKAAIPSGGAPAPTPQASPDQVQLGNGLPSLDTIQARANEMSPDPGAPNPEPPNSHSFAKTAGTVALGLAGVAAVLGAATPAQARTRVGVYVGPGGVSVNVRNHGHNHGGWGHGGWGGGWGGGGWNRPIPVPIPIPVPVPVPTYPTYPTNPNYDNHGPFRFGYGADGQYHRFDRFGHVNDNTGHYNICTNPYNGGWYYDNSGFCR